MVTLNHLYRLVIFTDNGFHTAVNVLYFIPTAVLGAGLDELGLANALQAFYLPFYRVLMTGSSSYDAVSIQDITAVPSPLPTGSTNAGTGGTAGTHPQAAQVCGVITLQTGFAGRAYRGRVYLPFTDLASNNADNSPAPSAGYIADLIALAAHLEGNENITTGADGFVISHVLYHRKTHLFTPILNTRSNTKWGTQRRRGRYRVAHE